MAESPGTLHKCKGCKKLTNSHAVNDHYLCCRCYVLKYDSPTDWHPSCMATWYEMHPEKRPEATKGGQ